MINIKKIIYSYFLIIIYFINSNIRKNISKFQSNKNIQSLLYNNKKNNIIKNSNKIIIYSALFGNYDTIKPIKRQKNFDYVLFTDINIKDKTDWTILKIPAIVNNLKMNIVKKQRFIKLHPHLFFKNYELSIYVDTTFIIFGNMTEFLERLITPKFDIYIFEHPWRNCIYSEILAVLKYKKDKRNSVLNIKNRYKKSKFPSKIGLSENCLIVRRHNKKKCIYLMENWWKEIKNYSKRDQLSLNYVLWKTGIKIKYISKQFGLKYFYHNKGHLKKTIKFNNTKNFKILKMHYNL